MAILAACEEELFTGPPGGGGGLLCPRLLAAAARGTALLRAARGGRLVLSGAGTSGRIAFLLARRHGPAWRETGGEVIPLVAGGSLALVKAREGAEDDAARARREAAAALGPPGRPALFLGISCGLSAPSLGGGLAAAADRPGTATIVFGTNRPGLARSRPIPGGGATLREMIARVGEAPGGCLVLPRVGAESVTGSTRLKCGSATWLLLDAMVAAALADLPPAEVEGWLADRLAAAREEFAALQAHRPFLTRLVARGGEALRGGGSILYLGAGEAGLAGLLDASECPPTFGAGEDDVRAFLAGGWAGLLGPGPAAEALERERPLTLTWAREHFLPALAPSSLPLLLDLAAGEGEGLEAAGLRPESLPRATLFTGKLALNVLTTGAHVLAGKVHGNLMIDLSISNSKLYHRALRIVGRVAGVGPEEARRALAAAIHDRDRPGRREMGLDPDQQARVAATREKVVPLAILVAARGWRLERARAALAAEPILRRLLQGER